MNTVPQRVRQEIFGLAIVLVLVTGANVEASVSHDHSNIFSLDTVMAVGDDAGEPPLVALDGHQKNNETE